MLHDEHGRVLQLQALLSVIGPNMREREMLLLQLVAKLHTHVCMHDGTRADLGGDSARCALLYQQI